MMSRFIGLAALGVALVAADQLIKYSIRNLMALGQSVPVVGDIIKLTYQTNTGAVFGIIKGANDYLIWIAIIAIGMILYLWDKFPRSLLARIFLVFILAGSVGNLIDRIFLGYVTDFIDIGFWPVFNLADSLVTVGVVGLVITMLQPDNTEKKTVKRAKAKTEPRVATKTKVKKR
jgi:signal peptidase II